MKALVVGFGSIGSRHYEVLSKLGLQVSLVSKRKSCIGSSFTDLSVGLEKFKPDYLVISNNTDDHIEALSTARNLGFDGPILVEKPISVSIDDIPELDTKNIFVAYNMRFNPLISRLRKELTSETVLATVIYAGQYLPDWRDNVDYKDSYSSIKSKGGGVLRDLSHELDFVTHLLGKWSSVSAIGGKFSNLKIETEDNFSILLETSHNNSVCIHLNYLDRSPKRFIRINTAQHSFEIDFVKKTFNMDGKIEQYSFERNLTYELQHKAILDNKHDDVTTFEEGKEILKLIDAIEKSALARPRKWIDNEKTM